jgi:hypothetical protein
VYSALPDVYGQLHLIPNTQNISLKSWWVGKILEHGFKRMIITKEKLFASTKNLHVFSYQLTVFQNLY